MTSPSLLDYVPRGTSTSEPTAVESQERQQRKPGLSTVADVINETEVTASVERTPRGVYVVVYVRYYSTVLRRYVYERWRLDITDKLVKFAEGVKADEQIEPAFMKVVNGEVKQ